MSNPHKELIALRVSPAVAEEVRQIAAQEQEAASLIYRRLIAEGLRQWPALRDDLPLRREDRGL